MTDISAADAVPAQRGKDKTILLTGLIIYGLGQTLLYIIFGPLARDVGLSTRQLERLFRRYLSRSPKRYYMELRLSKARNLLMQTDMSVINVALACGFTSPSHFSKCYRAHYHTTPYRERGAQASRLSI